MYHRLNLTINVVMNLNHIDDSYGDLSNIMSERLIAINKEVIDTLEVYTNYHLLNNQYVNYLYI